MPLCVGAWIEMLQQITNGQKLDRHIRNMRQMLVMDPLSFVPRSRRAHAELNLRIAEYYSMLGQPPGKVSRDNLRMQEMKITEARRKVENESRAALDRDREKLCAEPASKLDIAQLAVDLLAMGRSWMEHFNLWSESQERQLEANREEMLNKMQAMHDEIVEAIAKLEARLDRLEAERRGE